MTFSGYSLRHVHFSNCFDTDILLFFLDSGT